MAQVFSFTHLSGGQRIFLGNPRINSDKPDYTGYQYFDIYDDEYLDNRLGCIGIRMTSTVSDLWEFGQNDARKLLSEVMRLALPLLDLPISLEQYSTIKGGYFPIVELFWEGNSFYDEKNHIVHVLSGKSPEDFFKTVVFKGKFKDESVRTIILAYGYLESLSSQFGDFRFPSLELPQAIWPINPERVTRAYYGLVEDGFLEPTGGKTSSGFSTFTRIPSHTRRLIENIEEPTAGEVQGVTPDTEPTPSIAPYISEKIAASLLASAKTRKYHTAKLEEIIFELNDAVERNKALSAHSLTRALLDHIAPLFGHKTFAQVANNYSWTQTDKKRVQQLDTIFRFDADDSLHTPISSRATDIDMQSIPLIRRTINVILEEASNQK